MYLRSVKQLLNFDIFFMKQAPPRFIMRNKILHKLLVIK